MDLRPRPQPNPTRTDPDILTLLRHALKFRLTQKSVHAYSPATTGWLATFRASHPSSRRTEAEPGLLECRF
jgi:hypothetical protein